MPVTVGEAVRVCVAESAGVPVDVGMAVTVRVDVCVFTAVFVPVAVTVRVAVKVFAGEFVALGWDVLVLVAEAVTVRVYVAVFAGEFVGLGCMVFVRVAVMVIVRVDVETGVDVIVAVLVGLGCCVAVLVAVTTGVRVEVRAGGRHPIAAAVFCAAGAFISTTSSTHRSKLYGAPAWPCVCHWMALTADNAMVFVTSVLPQPSCENRTLEKSTIIFVHEVLAENTNPYMSSSSLLLNAAGEFIFSLKLLVSLLLHQKLRPVAELMFVGACGSFRGKPRPAKPYRNVVLTIPVICAA